MASACRRATTRRAPPGAGYRFPWSICQWLDGETARADRIVDPVRFALGLAGFLAALQSVDAAGGPQPGRHKTTELLIAGAS